MKRNTNGIINSEHLLLNLNKVRGVKSKLREKEAKTLVEYIETKVDTNLAQIGEKQAYVRTFKMVTN